VLPDAGELRGSSSADANPYGFKASINPSYHVHGDDGIGWVSPYHFGINEGRRC
jgi:hypothetical protein